MVGRGWRNAAYLVVFALDVGGRGRTTAVPWWVIILSAIGAALTLVDIAMPATLYGLAIGLVGVNLYVFWYSRLPRTKSDTLVVGEALPYIPLTLISGEHTDTHQLPHPALLLFIRGNWCPLCVAQVNELAKDYQQLKERGIQPVVISPQPVLETQKLAKKHQVPFIFCHDKNNSVAETLDIINREGVPVGLKSASSATVLPTVIMTNENAEIIYVDLTDNYRVRPHVKTIIKAFDEYKMLTQDMYA